MKILSVVESGGGFDVYVTFSLHDVPYDGVTDPITTIAYWVSHTFSRNFVILEKAERIIAGGAANNATAWDEGWNKEEKFSSIYLYELRGCRGDVTLFLLKYKEKE